MNRLASDEAFIQNIWAVGRNYADHAKELGHAAPEASADPMIFLKAGSCIVRSGATFSLPRFSHDVHHECEIALQFGPEIADGINDGRSTPNRMGVTPIFSHITIALDLTARDIQNELKAKAHPWTLAKSFRAACPIGPLMPLPAQIDLQNLSFALSVNGEMRQRGHTGDMIHPIEKIARFVLERFPVQPGDLLLTGTPVGVAAMKRGDRLNAEIEGVVRAEWTVSRE